MRHKNKVNSSNGCESHHMKVRSFTKAIFSLKENTKLYKSSQIQLMYSRCKHMPVHLQIAEDVNLRRSKIEDEYFLKLASSYYYVSNTERYPDYGSCWSDKNWEGSNPQKFPSTPCAREITIKTSYYVILVYGHIFISNISDSSPTLI